MGCLCSKIKIKENNNLHHEQELMNNSFSNLQKFTFEGIITKCRVVDVYDGDTVIIIFFNNNKPIKKSFRMFGYDSPEIKPLKSIEARSLHIEAANVSKKKLSELTFNKLLWVKFMNEDKYGRLMGELFEISNENTFTNDKSINNYMVLEGYGKKYFGDKKENFTITELNNILKK